jgi:hypothetical protein
VLDREPYHPRPGRVGHDPPVRHGPPESAHLQDTRIRPPRAKPRLSAATVCDRHTGPERCPPLSWYGRHALKALGGDRSIPSLRG